MKKTKIVKISNENSYELKHFSRLISIRFHSTMPKDIPKYRAVNPEDTWEILAHPNVRPSSNSWIMADCILFSGPLGAPNDCFKILLAVGMYILSAYS